MYDLIIIGLGPAGLNAGIYAKRCNLNVLAIEKEVPGGKLNSLREIHNYLGYENVTGPDLAISFYKQFKTQNIPIINEEVENIIDNKTSKTVVTTKNKYETKTLIIATGRGQKKLKEFNHIKGISYCVTCDANLYKDKEVALFGNNHQAIEEATYLSNIVRKVYLIINKDLIKEKLNNNIEIIYDETIKDIVEENSIINSIVLTNKTINVQGLFINLGSGPVTYFCDSLKITDKEGYILINQNQETKVKGIFACGDNTKKDIYQIITAASEGATAALNANKYVRNKGIE